LLWMRCCLRPDVDPEQCLGAGSIPDYLSDTG
jgi:hypothetical protein